MIINKENYINESKAQQANQNIISKSEQILYKTSKYHGTYIIRKINNKLSKCVHH